MIWEQVLGIAGALYLLLCCLVPRDPNQCNFIGAVIGAVGGLIGASKQRKENRRVNEANRPVNQVAEWEAAGINPLFGISSGGYVPHQAASIGDAYATAGARFGQAIDQRRAEKLAETELKKENTALKEKLDELATPRIPSYLSQYGAIIPVPTIGGTNANGTNSSGSPVRRNGVDGNSTSGVTDDIPSVLVPWRTEDGQIVMLPNPDLPDVDQYIPAMAGGAAGSVQDWFDIGPELPSIGETFTSIFGSREKRKRPRARPVKTERKPDAFEQRARELQSQNPYFRP